MKPQVRELRGFRSILGTAPQRAHRPVTSDAPYSGDSEDSGDASSVRGHCPLSTATVQPYAENVTDLSGKDPAPPALHVPAEEQVRWQGISPISTVDELAFPDVWESDEELREFLAELYASRRASLP
jgi:hypothetical protein